MNEDEQEESNSDFDPVLMEEYLEGLYRPGCYAEGELLCLDLMEELDQDWEPARLYLLLYLAAQDAEEEVAQMVDELEDDSLFEALRLLTFGADTETEELLYEDILSCIESRGLGDDLQKFLSNEVAPMARQDISSSLASWV
jgi:hypothetical protein